VISNEEAETRDAGGVHGGDSGQSDAMMGGNKCFEREKNLLPDTLKSGESRLVADPVKKKICPQAEFVALAISP
jgi:hypothetical protein